MLIAGVDVDQLVTFPLIHVTDDRWGTPRNSTKKSIEIKNPHGIHQRHLEHQLDFDFKPLLDAILSNHHTSLTLQQILLVLRQLIYKNKTQLSYFKIKPKSKEINIKRLLSTVIKTYNTLSKFMIKYQHTGRSNYIIKNNILNYMIAAGGYLRVYGSTVYDTTTKHWLYDVMEDNKNRNK